jgi:hypothetical protein
MQALDTKQELVAQELELAMLPMVQVACDCIHRFGPGLYIREVSMPAGTLVVGHHHNQEHMNIMLKGKGTLLVDGIKMEIEAPFMYVAGPGRKVAYWTEDTVWQNIFATEITDIETLELIYLTKSPAFAETIAGYNQMERIGDQEDYLDMLEEFGFTASYVRAMSERTDDATDLPNVSYKFQVGESAIEGLGLIATAKIAIGEIIAPSLIGGKRTIAGRYTNHAKEPNAEMHRHSNGDVSLQAIQTIQGNQGGFLGEEITVDYRQVLALREVT